VDSLANFQWTHAEEDDLLVEDLIDQLPLSEQVLAEKKVIALREKMVNGLLLSSDAKTTQITAKLQIENDPGNTHYMQVRMDIEKILAEEKARTGYQFHLQGSPIIDTAFKIYSQKDMKTIIPLMFGLITLILVFLFRSFWGTLLPILVVGFSVIMAMGISGLGGIKLNEMTANVPQIILAIAIADAIHILTTFLKQLKQGKDRKSALIYTIEKNLKPCFLTSLTTSIGFFSLLAGSIGPLRELGLMSGIGTIVAFLLTFSFLPSILAIVPFSARLRTPKKTTKGGWTEKLAGFVVAKHKPILGVTLLSTLLILVFLKNIRVNNNMVHYFKKGTDIRNATEFIEKNLIGTETLDFVVNTGQPDGIKSPEFLKELQLLQNYIETLPQVTKTTSLVDIMKQLNRSLHADQQQYYRIPQTQELVAQTLFLYTMSLPMGKDLNDTINVDNSKTRMTAFVRNQSSSEHLELIKRIEDWITINTPALNVKVVGKTVMFAFMQIALTNVFVKSILLALGLVTLTMVISFKSIKTGLLSMVPNVIPLLLTAGVMGMKKMYLDVGSVMVATVALGIAVDDTIHFLSKYRSGREQQMDRKSAVGYVYKEAATAIIFTTIVLVLGFGIFIFSQYNMTVYFGVLIATVLSFAVVCDLIFLPSILLWRQPSTAFCFDKTIETTGRRLYKLSSRICVPLFGNLRLCRNYFTEQND
jgi:predicted RND superfamily exporter protein